MEDKKDKKQDPEHKSQGAASGAGGKKSSGGGAAAGEPGALREEAGSPEGVEKPAEVGGPEEVKELKERLEAAEGKAREYLDDLQRLKAEFDNYRKRMIREQTSLIESANRELVGKLLPVLDNLERALESAGEDAQGGLAEGVRMVYAQLREILGQEGLEEVNPQGHPFDPRECEAVNAVISDDHEDETVVEVHQKGYRFRGQLLRPAMATVSRCPAEDGGEKGQA